MRPNGRPGAGHGVAHNIGESSGSGAHGRTSRRARVAESFPAPLAAPHGAPDDDYVEITLDVRMDSVSVHSLKPSADLKLLAQKLAKRPASHEAAGRGGFLLRDASTRLKQAVSRELRRPRGSQLGADDKPKSAAAHALKGLNFIRRADDDGPANSWAAVASRFDKHAVDGFLHRSYFGECIGMLPETEQRQGTQRPGGRGKGLQITAKKANQGEIAFAGKLFDALARRRCIASDSISKDELYEFWDILSDTSLNHSRLQIFFDMMDKNADGRITEEDIKEIITLSASANNLTKVREQSKQYARIIMEELDPEDVGNIEMYQLEMLLQMPISQSTTNSRNLSQILTDELRPTTKPNPSSPPQWYFMEETWRRCWVMLLWLSICMSLFVWKFVQYRRHAVFKVMGYCVCVAKGGAEMLKFNMALILLPVCRNTITWFRNSTTAGRFVPFDDNLNFHKVIALGVSLAAGLHVISHLTCDFPRLLHATKEEYQPMIPFFGKEKPPNYWWFIKGTEGWTGLVMLVLMAITFTLATPWFRTGKLRLPEPLKRLIGFNAFWYSHHLFVIVYGLLLVHGHFLYLTKTWQNKSTWMYLAVPMVIYACERLTRALRSSVWPMKIRKVAVYPGNVLSLYFSKPQGFRYKSGQYIFVKCGAVSQFQWHPFSITSSPNDDYVSVHIRTAGDWTSDLKKVFSKACKPPTDGKSGLLRAEFNDDSGTSNSSLPKVVIDGPYGAPAQDYTQYDIVLLVGLGIGATPMISIIKDIINNVNNPGTSAAVSFRTRRAYFYWVTREQGSFEWFHGVMDEVAETDKRSVIEFNSYLTSVHEAGDAMSTPIAVLQSLNHAKHGVDVVSGTRVKTHFGRPNWRDVYKRIAFHHRHQRVGVFYCGAPPLVKELRGLAQEFSTKTSTKFEFHKENF